MAQKKLKMTEAEKSELQEMMKVASSPEEIKAISEATGMPVEEVAAHAKNALQSSMGQILSVYEEPTPGWKDRALQYGMGALDYVAGGVRTGVGETALAIKAARDPNKEYDLGAAKERVLDAVVPDFIPYLDRATGHAERPAPSVGEYRKLGGWEMSPEQEAAPLIPGWESSFNPSQGTALNVGLDTLLGLSPAAFVKGAGKALGKQAGKMTYKEAEQALAAQLAKKPSIIEGGLFAVNEPLAKLGDALYRSRFKNADLATEAAGMRRFSDVMREGRASGITSHGIEKGVENLVSAKNADKLGIVEDVFNKAKTQATVPLNEAVAPLYSGDYQKELLKYGGTKSFKDSRTKAIRGLEETAVERLGFPLEELDNPEVAGTLRSMVKNQPLDVLDLEGMAKRAGDSARAARMYDKPGMMNVPSAGDRARFTAENMALGQAQDTIRDTARRTQGDLLDQMRPGAGGEVFQYNKDTASLLKGAPFVDRPFSKAPNSTRSAKFRLAEGAGAGSAEKNLLDLGQKIAVDSWDAGKLGTAKLLLNPWSRYGAQPLGRAAMVEEYAPQSRDSIWYYLDRAKKEK